MSPDALPLPERLEQAGISRRRFLMWCGAMTATLSLPAAYRTQIAQALENQKRPVLVWLEFQDCAGNTEGMLRVAAPTVTDIVLDTLSWEYHETIMAAAGDAAERNLERVVKEEEGKFICVVEGSIPMADDGVYCTIGGRTALDIAREVCPKAALNIAVGACAWDGGFVTMGPTGGVGLEEAVPEAKNVINLGGCPHNPQNTAAVITHYLTFGQAPALDKHNRPLFAYGDLIHDQCERRAYFDAGLFAEAWGDEGHRKGHCLYKLGCKGPAATYNCPNVRWNDGTSWPVQAGHGCIACASPRFWANMSPFYERLPDVPGFGADTTAEKVGLAVIGAISGATAVHGAAKLAQARQASRKEHEGAENQG